MMPTISSSSKNRTLLLSIFYIKIIKVFIPYEFEEDLKKMSNVGTFAKNVYCCVEHVDRFKRFKSLKEKFRRLNKGEIILEVGAKNLSKKDSTINKTDLENSKEYSFLFLVLNEINSLIRFDMNMKKLFTSINIENFDIVLFLLSILGKFDIFIDNLILLNIYNFLKEIDACKKYSNSEFYKSIFAYIISLNFDLYKIQIATSNDSSYFDKIKSEVTNFTLLINILNSLFSHSLEKTIDIEITSKLCQIFFEIVIRIIEPKGVKDKIMENKSNKQSQLASENYFTYLLEFETSILNSVLCFMNILYFSKNSEVDLIFSINHFIVANQENLLNFILMRKQSDLILFKNLIIFFQDLLMNMFNTKMEYLPENIQSFINNYGKFLQEILKLEAYKNDIQILFFLERTNEIFGIFEEKFSIAQSQTK